MNWVHIAVSCAAGALIFLVLVRLLHKPAARRAEAGKTGERREWPRFPARGSFEIYWHDPDGRECRSRASWIDISETGLGLKVSRPIATGSLLSLRGAETKIGGAAWVRHCTRRGRAWTAGVALKGSFFAGI